VPRARKEKGGIDLRRLPKITFRKLGRENVDGLASHPDFSEVTPLEPEIEVDPRLPGRKLVKIILHEALHVAYPGLPEETVKAAAGYQAMVLWHLFQMNLRNTQG
jgi:hypothetical protein